MNYGPLEFAAYLERRGLTRQESATVEAARAAAPRPDPAQNRLTVITGGAVLPLHERLAPIEAVKVFEAVAVRAPCTPRSAGPVRVRVRAASRPLVLVLSSHQRLAWELEVFRGARLTAVLISGYGESTVAGAGDATVSSIGGFYAFKRGSAQYQHLEQEVMRCTGRRIEHFQSVYAGNTFEIGGD